MGRDRKEREYLKHSCGRSRKGDALRIPHRLDMAGTFSALGRKAGKIRWEPNCRGP